MLALASCSKEALDTSKTAALELSEGEGGTPEGTIDPIMPTGTKEGRAVYLNGVSGSTQSVLSTYASPKVDQYVWDAEYYLNKDNFAGVGKRRDLMEFFTWTYALPDTSAQTAATLAAMRTSFSSFVGTALASIDVPQGDAWFEIANVFTYPDSSSINGGYVISARLGAGVIVESCRDGSCGNIGYESIAKLMYDETLTPVSVCEYPDGNGWPIYQPSALCPDPAPTPFLELAKTFTNRAEEVNGAYVPGICNPVPQAIYNSVIDVAQANISGGGAASYAMDTRDGFDSETECYGEKSLYTWRPEFEGCSELDRDCTNSSVSTLYAQLIGEAIDQETGINWASSGRKFYCTTDYDITFVPCGCSSDQQSWDSYIRILVINP